jgi:hypothetical protein
MIKSFRNIRNRRLLASLAVTVALVIPGFLLVPAADAATGQYTTYAGYSINFVNPDPQNHPLGASAIWSVPKVSCTENSKPISGQVVTWVGLGGIPMTGPPVEQTGTDSQCTIKNGKAKVTYWPWYEFTGNPKNPNPVNITLKTTGKDTISAGDHMAADVVEQGPGYFVTQLWDHTKGWYYDAIWQTTAGNVTPLTADWIVENPGALPHWPKFTGGILFQNCYWAQDAAQKQLGSGSGVTQYTLYSNSVQQDTTSAIGADNMSFTVQWLAYG